MLILTLYIMSACWQVEIVEGESPVNAQVYLDNGEVVDLIDFKITGNKPYSFAFQENGVLNFLDVFTITRLHNVDGINYQVTLENGETATGRISAFFFNGRLMDKPKESISYSLSEVNRIHFVSGSPLRSCERGHYERRTPYPFCPICGTRLKLGAFIDDEPEAQSQPPNHQAAPDHRNPASSSRRR